MLSEYLIIYRAIYDLYNQQTVAICPVSAELLFQAYPPCPQPIQMSLLRTQRDRGEIQIYGTIKIENTKGAHLCQAQIQTNILYLRCIF